MSNGNKNWSDLQNKKLQNRTHEQKKKKTNTSTMY